MPETNKLQRKIDENTDVVLKRITAGVGYAEMAPANNNDNGMKIAVLSEKLPLADRKQGWIYIIAK